MVLAAGVNGRKEYRVGGLAEPISHYTDAVEANGLLFVSGCVAVDGDGRLVDGGVVAQTHQVFANIGAILEAAGAGFADVVKVTVYLLDIEDRPRINAVRREVFGAARPASTLVEVSRLAVPGACVEIDAIAHIGEAVSMRATGINHVSISAPDLDASIRFYTQVFGMERVPAPKFPDQVVAWLRLEDQQLHLFQREGAPQYHHFALDVDDFEAAYLKIRELEITDESTFLSGIRELPGGEAQMYLRDPGGNLVEVNWPDASSLDRSVVTDIVRLADIVPQGAEGRAARLYTGGGDQAVPERLGQG